MQIIDAAQFDDYWKLQGSAGGSDPAVDSAVREIIEAVRSEGDAALRRYAQRFDRSSPQKIEVPFSMAEAAWETFCKTEDETAAALKLAACHIGSFAELQRKQFADFETEISGGLFAGQQVIPVERAAVYVPAGRFPLFSSVLMGMIPALAAGVEEILLASPPMEDGFPDRRILAAAVLAAQSYREETGTAKNHTAVRIFAMGGAQAIAALALGTCSVPRAAVIVGPGNKYVAAAKRMLFGEVGIDFVAGPTDVLIIAEEETADMAELVAADMLAQAEHDPDARARALVPDRAMAEKIQKTLEKQLAALPEASQTTAAASLNAGGVIIVYRTKEEAIRIANIIAPEHLELFSDDPESWVTGGDNSHVIGGMAVGLSAEKTSLKNYGSLFIGALAAEVLGDYSAGINHTLPTSGSARFTGGLSVRHFLKTVTTLRCVPGAGFEEARKAAEILGRAEGLAAHASAALVRCLP
jgi:histidinol dehydrogenase